jgi:hypothetical protein
MYRITDQRKKEKKENGLDKRSGEEARAMRSRRTIKAEKGPFTHLNLAIYPRDKKCRWIISHGLSCLCNAIISEA